MIQNNYLGCDPTRSNYIYLDNGVVLFYSMAHYLRDLYPDQPFYPLRHPTTEKESRLDPMTKQEAAQFDLEKYFGTIDKRVLFHLALAFRVKIRTKQDHFAIFEFIMQNAPYIITCIQHPDPKKRPFVFPNENVIFSARALPRLPISSMNYTLQDVDPKISGKMIDENVYNILWCFVVKCGIPTTHIGRGRSVKLVKTLRQRIAFDFNMDVMLIYGFLGGYLGATQIPSFIVCLAFVEWFRCAGPRFFSNIPHFVKQFECFIYFSWAMYVIDQIEMLPVLDSMMRVFPSRKFYVARIRAVLDDFRIHVEKLFHPVALTMILNPTGNDPAVKDAWGQLFSYVHAVYHRYIKCDAPNYLFSVPEKIYESMKEKIQSTIRREDIDCKLPPMCRPTQEGYPTGCHPVIDNPLVLRNCNDPSKPQFFLKKNMGLVLQALFFMANVNVLIANEPMFELLLPFGITEELYVDLKQTIVNLCCRGGCKNALCGDTERWLKMDPYGTMLVEQYIVFLEMVVGNRCTLLPHDITIYQQAALARRLNVSHFRENIPSHFFYCVGCNRRAVETVHHPLPVFFHSIRSMQNGMQLENYTYFTTQIRGKPRKQTNAQSRSRTIKPDHPHFVNARQSASKQTAGKIESSLKKVKIKPVAILKRVRVVGGRTSKRSPLINFESPSQIICSRSLELHPTIENKNTWCAYPLQSSSVVGSIKYLHGKGYTTCVECGNTEHTSYVNTRRFGPVCSVHPFYAAYYKHFQKWVDVGDPELNDFLNADNVHSEIGMCQINSCLHKAMPSSQPSSLESKIFVIESNYELGCLCVCSQHYANLKGFVAGHSLSQLRFVTRDAILRFMREREQTGKHGGNIVGSKKLCLK